MKVKSMRMKYKTQALYVHIPFCKKICSYCDFAKLIYNEKMVDNYMSTLYNELKTIPQKKFKTIYIGGGTPSCLPLFHLEKLLSFLSSKLSKDYEFTIECNVEDINDDFLKIITKYNINRISVGVQTFNEKFIKLCNRTHDKKMVFENVNLAKKYIKNVSVDMIYGFPTQTLLELNEDLELINLLDVKHISYYSLLIEPNTALYYKKYETMDDNIQAKMYKTIYKFCQKKGFKRYEISNFAKKGYESKHNLVYWHAEHYYGIGLNASGYLDNIRYKNTRNFTNYITDNNQKEEIILSLADIKFEYIMLHLRLDSGIRLKNYYKKFNSDFLSDYLQVIQQLVMKRLLLVNKTKVRATFKGSMLLNVLLEEFL